VFLRAGPFWTHFRSQIPGLVDEIVALYDGHPISADRPFADFHVSIARPKSLRRWFRPQVQFRADGIVPFHPLPFDQALPMFEWGLNWCVANYVNHFLIIHAAVIARADGRAAIMPGAPGSGKSTLAAGLANRGWRLLSDELALISLADGQSIYGMARPVSLKNESIDVLRRFAPKAKLSRVVHDTAKGSVALLKPPAASVARVMEPARPAWIVFPKYASGVPALLEPRRKAGIMIEIGKNAFNYNVHGARGFTILADIVEACECYKLTYSQLDEAVEIFDRLEPRH